MPAMVQQQLAAGIVRVDPGGDLELLPGRGWKLDEVRELLGLRAEDAPVEHQVAVIAPACDRGEAVALDRGGSLPPIRHHRRPQRAPGDSAGRDRAAGGPDVGTEGEINVVLAEDLGWVAVA